MKNISFNRIMQVIKWNLIANKRQIVRSFLSIGVGMLLVALFSSNMVFEHHPMDAYRIKIASDIAWILVAGFALHGAVSICSNMRSKNDIFNYLMLPATKPEKFLANVFHQCVTMFVVGLLALVAADLVQMLTSWVLCGNSVSFIKVMFDAPTTAPAVERALVDVCGPAALIIFTHSIFMLGGSFFRKHPLMKTLLAITFIPLVLSLIFVSGGAYAVEWLKDNNYSLSIELLWSKETMEWILVGVLTLLAVLNYWLSYRIFRRIQIINNRFFN